MGNTVMRLADGRQRWLNAVPCDNAATRRRQVATKARLTGGPLPLFVPATEPPCRLNLLRHQPRQPWPLVCRLSPRAVPAARESMRRPGYHGTRVQRGRHVKAGTGVCGDRRQTQASCSTHVIARRQAAVNVGRREVVTSKHHRRRL